MVRALSILRYAAGYLALKAADIDERKNVELALLSLTPHEMEVLKLMCEGRSNPKIVKRLVVSTRTAKLHVQNVIEKFVVADRK